MESEFANKRYYQLQIRTNCSLNCSYCPGLGLIADQKKVHQDLILSLRKARSGNYSAALVPCNALEMDDLDIVVETIKSFSIQPILQINARQLQTHKARIDEVLEWGVGIQLIWGNNISTPEGVLSQICDRSEDFFITIVAHKRMHALESFRSLPDTLKPKAYFYFPYHLKNTDEFFTVESIYEFLKRFRVQFPGFKAQPTPGIDIYDQRKRIFQEFEPTSQPLFTSPACDSPSKNLAFSVIISTFNDEQTLPILLKSLAHQSLSHSKYEVIVIDEGSTDDTVKTAIQFGKQGDANFQMKVLRLPRFMVSSNEKSDHRTAVSLNLAVKNSGGEHLFFLDAQSIAPKDTLFDLLEQHNQWDFIQTQRRLLPADIESLHLEQMNVDYLTPLSEPENPFWTQFYQHSQNWNQMSDGWRYISSKNLSVRRDVFEYVGWFRKSFLYYGFEDSDLGYRAKKKGFNFFLSPNSVFQVSANKDVSRFIKKGFDQQSSLSKMAKVFFQNNLDTDIYEHLRSYM